jgi:hypothetical protein
VFILVNYSMTIQLIIDVLDISMNL